MEKELIELQMENIYAAFPTRPAFLTLRQAAQYLKMDPRTLQADHTFPLKNSGNRSYKVNTVAMARWMLR